MKKLLIIEDDEVFAAGLVRALSRRDYICQIASKKSIAAELCSHYKPDYILMDLNLGEENTQDFITIVRKLCPQACLVILTGYGTIPSAVAAIKDGANAYITKPATPELIDKTLLESKRDTTKESLWELENEHIMKIVEECGGNISQAAIKLGLHRRTLQRRLKKI